MIQELKQKSYIMSFQNIVVNIVTKREEIQKVLPTLLLGTVETTKGNKEDKVKGKIFHYHTSPCRVHFPRRESLGMRIMISFNIRYEFTYILQRHDNRAKKRRRRRENERIGLIGARKEHDEASGAGAGGGGQLMARRYLGHSKLTG